MYAGIVISLTVLYIIYTQVTSKKPEFDGQLTMADVVKDKSPGQIELSESDRLLQAIDNLPEISKELNGTLAKEAFLLVRNLISKHVQVEFKGKKDELMNQRLTHFKEGDWQNYVKMIGMAA